MGILKEKGLLRMFLRFLTNSSYALDNLSKMNLNHASGCLILVSREATIEINIHLVWINFVNYTFLTLGSTS